MANSTHHCRNDAALGHAARMLLLNVCEPGCGYSDHDIPPAVWSILGVEFEAFLATNEPLLATFDDISDRDLGHWWIGDRNGEGIGFNDYYPCRRGLDALAASAASQGRCEIYAGDDGNLYFTDDGQIDTVWEAAYEAAREVYNA